jgi:hypothetical protein
VRSRFAEQPRRRGAAASRGWLVAAKRELRWWLLQVAGVSAFALGLVLILPPVLRFAGPPSRPELEALLAPLPDLGLYGLSIQAPGLPAYDAGPAVPFLLGLLLLHAAFITVMGGGPRARLWTALLAGMAGGLMLSFGSNPTGSSYAAALAVVGVVAALIGGDEAPATRDHQYPRTG